MIKIYLGSFLLLTIGLVAGVFLSSQTSEPSTFVEQSPSAPLETMASADVQTQARITELESGLAALNARLKLLESRETTGETTGADEELDQPAAEPPLFSAFGGGDNSVAVVDGLMAAGLDSFRAEQIARRVSESQLKQLELRDKAIREGYIGSEQYREEMAAIRNERVQVRNEIDESSYDRYLYFSGQSNRVAVSSVMLGSAAENSGLKAGDVLVRYDDDALYKPGDVRGLTTQGEKDELVDLTLMRDGNQMTVSIPRGPLGVRLTAIRINPDDT